MILIGVLKNPGDRACAPRFYRTKAVRGFYKSESIRKLEGMGEMEFRLANANDLANVKEVFSNIIVDMEKNNISIWDEIYPCDFFEQDIKENNLYVLYDNDILISAFTVLQENAGEKAVKWKYNASNPVYIDRLGVNPDFSRCGIGKMMLGKAMDVARDLGSDCLRLFVVDINIPAISLYERMGFQKVEGIYSEVIDKDYILKEYGYEYKLE